tara:strand:- start:7969 stop:8973 length:1005 start_codon:yes stop_codon:yes gene_type:complete
VPVHVKTSAPTRIDLAGGTLDIWPLYLFHPGAQTINVAIGLRATCSIQPSQDGRIHITSKDTGTTLTADHWQELDTHGAHRLLAHIARFFQVDNISITTEAASPLGAGIAGSSALNIAVCAGLAHWTNANYPPDQLFTLAMNLEAQTLRIPTGVQDYRPAVYGGIAAIELGALGIRHVPLDINLSDFERRIVLAYSGDSRSSGINNWDITKRHIDGSDIIAKHFDHITKIAAATRDALIRHDWAELATQIKLEWQERQALDPKVTTPAIDRLITQAEAAGALAGKVCGAGGGGCVFFLIDPNRRDDVCQAIIKSGSQLLESSVDIDGLSLNSNT